MLLVSAVSVCFDFDMSAKGSIASMSAPATCPVTGVPGNLGNAGYPVLPAEGIALDAIQAPKHLSRIMRYELTDFEGAANTTLLPNKPRRIPRTCL